MKVKIKGYVAFTKEVKWLQHSAIKGNAPGLCFLWTFKINKIMLFYDHYSICIYLDLKGRIHGWELES
jgi:hypothetical protein